MILFAIRIVLCDAICIIFLQLELMSIYYQPPHVTSMFEQSTKYEFIVWNLHLRFESIQIIPCVVFIWSGLSRDKINQYISVNTHNYLTSHNGLINMNSGALNTWSLICKTQNILQMPVKLCFLSIVKNSEKNIVYLL